MIDPLNYGGFEQRIHHLMDCLEIEKKKEKLNKLEKENNWKLGQEIADLAEDIESVEDLQKEFQDLGELIGLRDESLAIEIEEKINSLHEKIEKQETKVFLSGRYDKGNAIMEIFAGAGGADAQDWATMLLRMFSRYCEKKGFGVKIIHQSFGEAGGPEGRIGTKSAILEIKGKFAYGILRRESGVHRLVRQSPFSGKDLRHTSFALASVIPEISGNEQTEITIRPEDLRVDLFRSSGPGGQNVNKRETAVRVTHIPTGIVVSSQVERSQASNKEKAMKVLFSKLYQLKEEERGKVLKEVRGEQVSASWGNQIRSYVLHPYKLVKDLRTGVEDTDPEKVLDGELDKFVEAEIKISNF
ncbi:MAG: peptide chain release factor 2 [bacterium]|nr:peptide chain release factor 2 [bacterium]